VDYQFFAGRIAALIGVIAYGVYLNRLIHGETKPCFATWLIWGFVDGIIFPSFLRSGSHETWITPGSYALCNMVIATIVFLKWRREGRAELELTDKICILIGLSALGILLTDRPVVAMFLGIAAKTAGTIPTLRRVRDGTGKEDPTAWLMWSIANTINFTAITKWGSYELPLPLFYMVQTYVVFGFILRFQKLTANGRKDKRRL
jgi:hypothetical protein